MRTFGFLMSAVLLCGCYSGSEPSRSGDSSDLFEYGPNIRIPLKFDAPTTAAESHEFIVYPERRLVEVFLDADGNGSVTLLVKRESDRQSVIGPIGFHVDGNKSQTSIPVCLDAAPHVVELRTIEFGGSLSATVYESGQEEQCPALSNETAPIQEAARELTPEPLKKLKLGPALTIIAGAAVLVWLIGPRVYSPWKAARARRIENAQLKRTTEFLKDVFEIDESDSDPREKIAKLRALRKTVLEAVASRLVREEDADRVFTRIESAMSSAKTRLTAP